MEWKRIEPDGIVYTGHIMDVVNRTQIDGELHIKGGKIADIVSLAEGVPADAPYIMPGFVDAHVHIESSMMLPAAFAQVAVHHGTIGVMADPHEIGNVLGVAGIEVMLQSAKQSPFHFAFGAPSCIPSCGSDIETSGFVVGSQEIKALMARDDIHFLGEMMNFPGVLNRDAEVMAKIQAAIDAGKPVDGHAPGLVGDDRQRYASAGITTDHECFSMEAAESCVANGMYVLIREGSAAKNFDVLAPLIARHPDHAMFCCDDCHPYDFVNGHVDRMVRRAITLGYNIWDILQVASVNAVKHYRQPWGLLQPGDAADFIVISDLSKNFQVLETIISGESIFHIGGKSEKKCSTTLTEHPNFFLAHRIEPKDIARILNAGDTLHIIQAFDGSLLTEHEVVTLPEDYKTNAELKWNEVQKIIVLNRYRENAAPQVGYIRGFQLKDGAMAATVAHDCHNIVAIGTSDEQICRAINRIVEMHGGMVAIAGSEMADIPLPIAGLISPLDGFEVARRSAQVEEMSHAAGCRMASPFITMGFMCLPVIPQLKLTDKGLFDGNTFSFVE